MERRIVKAKCIGEIFINLKRKRTAMAIFKSYQMTNPIQNIIATMTIHKSRFIAS